MNGDIQENRKKVWKDVRKLRMGLRKLHGIILDGVFVADENGCEESVEDTFQISA